MMKVTLFLIVAVFAPDLLCKPNGNLNSNYDQREYTDNGWNIQESLQTYSDPGQNSVSWQGDIGTSVGQIPEIGSMNPNQGPSVGQIPNPGSLNPNQGPGLGQTPGQWPSYYYSIPTPGPQGFLPGELSWGPFKFRFNWSKFSSPRPWDTNPFEKPFPIGDIVSFESPIPLPAPRPWNTNPFEQSPPPLSKIPAFNFPDLLNDYQNYIMRATYNKNYDSTQLGGPPGSTYNTNVVVDHYCSHERYGN
ncbi:hypothetical protein KQX54_003936 [Cotesia glomerata]|uniref:Uncharacterized protein n=1 Tax=Cotesia glomerata TaxID=32391 RepID=A0AAV7IRX8_COTGL|nr:hypothetical protein KQX54_003936 [Cotesia glomerata]